MNRKISVECLRCGKCCLANVLSFATDADFQRWEAEKRADILHVIEHYRPVWAGDHLISVDDGHYLHGCPFLSWDGDRCKCTIYETRPEVCGRYQPGSSQICPQWHRNKA